MSEKENVASFPEAWKVNLAEMPGLWLRTESKGSSLGRTWALQLEKPKCKPQLHILPAGWSFEQVA